MEDTHLGLSKKISYETLDDVSEEDIEFMWYEGNFSCNCNRIRTFYPEDKDTYENAHCFEGEGEDRFKLIDILNEDGKSIL